jgi:hypothetical protein
VIIRCVLALLLTGLLVSAAPPLEQQFLLLQPGQSVRLKLRTGQVLPAHFRSIGDGSVTILVLEDGTISERSVPVASIAGVKARKPPERRQRVFEAIGALGIALYSITLIAIAGG